MTDKLGVKGVYFRATGLVVSDNGMMSPVTGVAGLVNTLAR